MITKNTDGTYTVAGVLTCLSEQAARALLEDTGAHPLVDPLTIQAAQPPRHQYTVRADEYNRLRLVMIETA